MRWHSSITTCMSCSTIRIVKFLRCGARAAWCHASPLHSAGGRLVETQQGRLGRKRNADLQIALFAVGQIGGKLVRLIEQAHD